MFLLITLLTEGTRKRNPIRTRAHLTSGTRFKTKKEAILKGHQVLECLLNLVEVSESQHHLQVNTRRIRLRTSQLYQDKITKRLEELQAHGKILIQTISPQPLLQPSQRRRGRSISLNRCLK